MYTSKEFMRFVLLFFIALILSAGIGFYAYKNGQIKLPASTTPINSPTPKVDPTSDWKTYTNTLLGYSIKHPQSWDVRGMLQEDGKRESPETSINSYLSSSINDKEIVFKEELYVYKTFEENAKEWYRYYLSSTSELGNSKTETLKDEYIEMDGKNAIKHTISYEYGDMLMPGTTVWIYVPLSGKHLLSIKYYSEKSDQNELQLYDQILSTFKFLD